MKIPFVIDNREHTLADVLNDLLNQFENRSIDIATAYFTMDGGNHPRERAVIVQAFAPKSNKKPDTPRASAMPMYLPFMT